MQLFEGKETQLGVRSFKETQLGSGLSIAYDNERPDPKSAKSGCFAAATLIQETTRS